MNVVLRIILGIALAAGYSFQLTAMSEDNTQTGDLQASTEQIGIGVEVNMDSLKEFAEKKLAAESKKVRLKKDSSLFDLNPYSEDCTGIAAFLRKGLKVTNADNGLMAATLCGVKDDENAEKFTVVAARLIENVTKKPVTNIDDACRRQFSDRLSAANTLTLTYLENFRKFNTSQQKTNQDAANMQLQIMDVQRLLSNDALPIYVSAYLIQCLVDETNTARKNVLTLINGPVKATSSQISKQSSQNTQTSPNQVTKKSTPPHMSGMPTQTPKNPLNTSTPSIELQRPSTLQSQLSSSQSMYPQITQNGASSVLSQFQGQPTHPESSAFAQTYYSDEQGTNPFASTTPPTKPLKQSLSGSMQQQQNATPQAPSASMLKQSAMSQSQATQQLAQQIIAQSDVNPEQSSFTSQNQLSIEEFEKSDYENNEGEGD